MPTRTSSLGLSVNPGPAPNVTYDDGGATGLSNLGSTFLRLSTALGEKADKAGAIAGLEKGAITALSVNLDAPPPLTRGTDAESQNFDRALLAGYWDRVQLTTSRKVRELAETSGDDAGAMVDGAQQWAKGMKKNMPASLQTDFDIFLEKQTAPFVTAAANRQRETAVAGYKATLGERGDDLMENARQMGFLFAGSDDPGQMKTALAAAQSSVQSLVRSLAAGVQNRIIDPASARATLAEKVPEFNSAALQGMFAAAPNKEAIKNAFAEGKLRVPLAKLVQTEDGSYDLQIVPDSNPSVLLDMKAQNDLRGYMDASIKTVQQSQDRAKSATEAATTAANARVFSDLSVAVVQGKATYTDVETAYSKGLVSPEQRVTLTKDIDRQTDEQQKAMAEIGRVQTALVGGVTLDPGSAADRKAIDKHYELTAASWKGLPPEDVVQRSVQYTQQLGMVPSPVKALIRGGLRGGDAGQALLAANTVQQIGNANPQILNDFSTDDLRLATIISSYTDDGVPPQEALTMAKEHLAVPEATRKQRGERFDLELGATPAERMTADRKWIEGKLNSVWTSDPSVDPAMQSDFESLTRSEYERTGNLDAARSMALQMVNRVWGRTEVGGAFRYMKFAPEKFYGVPNLSPSENAKWMTEQLLADASAGAMLNKPLDAKRVVIGADPRFPAKDGRPTYVVNIIGDDGVFYPVTGKNGQPMQWAPNWDASAERKRRGDDYEKKLEALRAARGNSLAVPPASIGAP